MSLVDYYNRKIPEYYDTMYLDGFTPEQILAAARKNLVQGQEEPVEVNVKSEVSVKK